MLKTYKFLGVDRFKRNNWEITQLVIGDDQYEVVDIRWSGRVV